MRCTVVECHTYHTIPYHTIPYHEQSVWVSVCAKVEMECCTCLAGSSPNYTHNVWFGNAGRHACDVWLQGFANDVSLRHVSEIFPSLLVCAFACLGFSLFEFLYVWMSVFSMPLGFYSVLTSLRMWQNTPKSPKSEILIIFVQISISFDLWLWSLQEIITTMS